MILMKWNKYPETKPQSLGPSLPTLPSCLIWIELPGCSDPLFKSENPAHIIRLAVYLYGKWLNPQGDEFPQDMKVTHYMPIDEFPKD